MAAPPGDAEIHAADELHGGAPKANSPSSVITRMATIKDVAKLAGVSFKTVSRVINRSPHLKDEMRQRVLRAIDALEYRPHHTARHLRTGRSNVLAFINDDIAMTPFAGRIIQGAQEVSWRNGMLLLTLHTGGDRSFEKAAIQAALERQVEGIIFATMYHRGVEVPETAFGPPIVLVDCFAANRMHTSVVPDEIGGGYVATKCLLEKGHRRIAMINADLKYPAAAGRLEGYRKALADFGVKFDARLVRTGGWWQEDGYEHAISLLERGPTGIFCVSDRVAMGVYDALKERGLRVPEDVSVVGFDDQELIAPHVRPPLTTIRVPYFEMGSWAVEHLVKKLAGDTDEPMEQPVKLECPLVQRASVAKPSRRSR
jgi:LacI family transcriptional regulator